MASVDYFYDGQIRRFLNQVVRAFSGFQYEVVINGVKQLKTVPVTPALQNKQVAAIMSNNSENVLLSTPAITVYIKGVEKNLERVQNPAHVSTVQVTEREFDTVTGKYTSNRGNSYTVERIMPHPLDVTIAVDIWTSNEFQKHQLFEQIYMAFNSDFDIQSSDNALDWTALSRMHLQDVNWSSRTIPIGSQDIIDVMTFTFLLPMWISPPAKVKEQHVIQQIIANIVEGSEELAKMEAGATYGDQYDSSGELMGRTIVTPGDYKIAIQGNEVMLLDNHGSQVDENGNPYDWQTLLYDYGKLIPAVSQLRLRANIEQSDDLDIIGTIQLDASRSNVLIWQVDLDTLPGNTLMPINGVIEPHVNYVGQGLPTPKEGDRYMILSSIGPCEAWGNLVADVNDIVEFKNGAWVRVFDASSNTVVQYIVNLRSGKQLKFQDGQWIFAIDGEYNPGFWRLYL